MLQITSAQQNAPIHFILPHLKLNRTGASTHWRRKHKTRSIRSTKSDRLTTRIRCGHNKQSEATRSTSARLCSSVSVPPLCYQKMTVSHGQLPRVLHSPPNARTSTLRSLNEATMSTRLHTARQVNAAHWCAATPTNLLHNLTK